MRKCVATCLNAATELVDTVKSQEFKAIEIQ